MDNSCGLNGCLHFYNEFKSTRIVKGYQVKIDAIVFFLNNVSKGIGLKVSTRNIRENKAFSQGGGI